MSYLVALYCKLSGVPSVARVSKKIIMSKQSENNVTIHEYS